MSANHHIRQEQIKISKNIRPLQEFLNLVVRYNINVYWATGKPQCKHIENT